MGNPLACAVALASLDLLEHARLAVDVARIERRPRPRAGAAARGLPGVADVRTIGAVGRRPARPPGRRGRGARRRRVDEGVWLRPFRDLIYTMPPYVTHRRRPRPDLRRRSSAAVGGDAMTRGRTGSTTESAAPRRGRAAPDAAPARGRRRHRRPGRQRLPRPVPRPRGRRRRPRRPRDAGAPAPAPPGWSPARWTLHARARARARRRSSGSPRRWCSRPATTPTSPPSPRWPTATRWSSPTPTCTPRWSTPCRLSRAEVDDRAAQRRGRGRRGAGRRRATRRALVLAESVYSVLGDAAPLPRWPRSASGTTPCWSSTRRTGSGVAAGRARPGPRARPRRASRTCVVTATLSKSLGSQGGAVLGSPAVRRPPGQPGPARSSSTPASPRPRRVPRSRRCGVLRARPELPTLVRRRMTDLAAALGVAPRRRARCCRCRCRRRRSRWPRRRRP